MKTADFSPDLWKTALTRAGMGVWDWDLRADTCFYSDSWYAMLGYAPGELPEASDLWLQLTHPDDRDRAIRSGEQHIYGDAEGIETELRLRHKDGRWIWVLDRGGVVEWDEAGRPVRVIGVQTDITPQKTVEFQLEQTNWQFDLALEAARMGIWQFDPVAEKSYWDQRTREIFGLRPGPEELERSTWHSYLHPEDRVRAEAAHAAAAVKSAGTTVLRYRIVRADGAVRHVETLAQYAEKDGWKRLIGSIRDVTDEVAAAETLEAEKERFQVTLRAIDDGVVSSDIEGNINFVNRAAQTLLGDEAALLGRRFSEVVAQARADAPPFASDTPLDEDVLVLARKGEPTLVHLTNSPIRAQDGRILGAVHSLKDMTSEWLKKRELAHAARHDALTGLLNRSALDDVMRRAIDKAPSERFTLLYLDLDYFKALNDYGGHAAGDDALRAIAELIRARLPQGASAARLGGDEFVIVLPGDVRAAEEVAKSLIAAVGTLQVMPSRAHPPLGASIGIAELADAGTLPADLLARADDACYAAKTSGRNRFAVFSAEWSRHGFGLTSAKIMAEVNQGKEDGRLQLYGQELRRIDDPYTSCGRVEVLARLTDRDGRFIPPAEFIPAGERFGMAPMLDRWVLRRALTRFGGEMAEPGALTLGINLSAQTLSDPELWTFVDDTICRSGAHPQNLVFEITETAAFTNVDAAERFFASARERGCRLSLDDFGAGLSSFQYLRRFPIDSIKIDGSFIENLAENKFDRAIVSSIARIAKTVGYNVVAEKIENEDVLDVLRTLKVKYGQGFHLHRPEPLEAVVARFRQSGLTNPARARR